MESKKKKVGLFLPVALADALDGVAARVGKKQKWLVVGAALIRLLEAREEDQNDLIRRVKIADLPGGSFNNLIAQARSHAGGAPGFANLVADDGESDEVITRGRKPSAKSIRRSPQRAARRA